MKTEKKKGEERDKDRLLQVRPIEFQLGRAVPLPVNLDFLGSLYCSK